MFDHDPVRTRAATADDRWPLRLQRSVGDRAVNTLLRQIQRVVGWAGKGAAPVSSGNATETAEFAIRRFPVEDASLGAAGGNVSASQRVPGVLIRSAGLLRLKSNVAVRC
jgi:hypothetical protein